VRGDRFQWRVVPADDAADGAPHGHAPRGAEARRQRLHHAVDLVRPVVINGSVLQNFVVGTSTPANNGVSAEPFKILGWTEL
jgi:hypothetical protein